MKFKVEYVRYATTEIEAESQEDAERKANSLPDAVFEVSDWEFMNLEEVKESN